MSANQKDLPTHSLSSNLLLTKAVSPEAACLTQQIQSFLDGLIQSAHSSNLNEPITTKAKIKLLVAYSGGMDSTVLLYLLNALVKPDARYANIDLHAMYVNHGLSLKSDLWAEHCKNFCSSLGVDFSSVKVEIKGGQRKGMEAEARELRYSALIKNLQDLSRSEEDKLILVTGHHQRDQAETLLHNLARGSGINGLAAMPLAKKIGFGSCLEHYRPLLNVSYSTIQAFAKAQGLNFVDDESNKDTDITRNFVRHELLPVLEARWPSIQNSLSQAANNMQEALGLLDEFTEQQFSDVNHTKHYIEMDLAWSEAMQKNMLRYWLRYWWPNIVLSAKHYRWVIESLAYASSSSNHNFKYLLKEGELRVYQNRVYYLNSTPAEYDESFEGLDRLHDFVMSEEMLSNYSKMLVNNELNDEVVFNSEIKLVSYAKLTDELKKSLKPKKLKAFFQSNKIPTWERKVWPVIITGQSVVLFGCKNCHSHV